jgi:hypothetical protein
VAQTPAERVRQLDPLGLASREGSKWTIEGQVFEADLGEKAKPSRQLPEGLLGDYVTITTGLKKQPDMQIAISGYIKPTLSITPRQAPSSD